MPVIKARPTNERACRHCGSFTYFVAKCPGRTTAEKRLEETPERSDDEILHASCKAHEIERSEAKTMGSCMIRIAAETAKQAME